MGAKIDALDRLRGMDAATQKLYSGQSRIESRCVDADRISRHSDKDWRKARAVVETSEAESALARQLGSRGRKSGQPGSGVPRERERAGAY